LILQRHSFPPPLIHRFLPYPGRFLIRSLVDAHPPSISMLPSNTCSLLFLPELSGSTWFPLQAFVGAKVPSIFSTQPSLPRPTGFFRFPFSPFLSRPPQSDFYQVPMLPLLTIFMTRNWHYTFFSSIVLAKFPQSPNRFLKLIFPFLSSLCFFFLLDVRAMLLQIRWKFPLLFSTYNPFPVLPASPFAPLTSCYITIFFSR